MDPQQQIQQFDDELRNWLLIAGDGKVELEDSVLDLWKRTINSVPSSQAWEDYKKAKSIEIKELGNKVLVNGGEQADFWFSLAILFDPNNYVFYSNRSAAYANKGMYKEAVKDAETVISLNPEWPKGYSRKGLAYYYLREFDSSLAAYKQGLELNPDNETLREGYEKAQNTCKAHNMLERAEEFLCKNKPKVAVDYLNKAINLEPNDFLFYSARSEANLRAGYYQNSLNDAETLMRMRPDWAKGYLRRANALYSLRRYDDAAATCSNGLKLEPENDKLKTLMNNAVTEGFRARQREDYEKQKAQEEKKEGVEEKVKNIGTKIKEKLGTKS